MAKRKKSMKFPSVFTTKVDMSKINREQFKRWTGEKIVELFGGLEDEFLINYVHAYLDQPEIDPEDMLISLNDLLEHDTVAFMEELWTLLIDAQSHSAGIPKAFIQAARASVDARMQERGRVAHGMRQMGHSSNSNGNYRNDGPSDTHVQRKSRHPDEDPSDRSYGLQSHHQRPSDDQYRRRRENTDHRPRSRLDQEPSRDFDRDSHHRRHNNEERPISIGESSPEGEVDLKIPSSRDRDDERRYQERRHRGEKHSYDSRYRDERSRDEEGRYSRYDDRQGRHHGYASRIVRDDDRNDSHPEVDAFGRDARPTIPISRETAPSSVQIDSKYSQPSSKHDAEEEEGGVLSHSSKKRLHEAGTNDEPIQDAKRSRRS
jgi:serine/arginine repetitive matrix protein 1